MKSTLRSLALLTLVVSLFVVVAPTAYAASVPGDIDGSGTVDAVDVQLVINATLGINIGSGLNADVNGDSVTNAVDVQLVINAALGIDISSQVWAPDTSTFNVTLASDVTEVDPSNLDVVVSSDQTNHIYTLDATKVQNLGLDLTVGRVLILPGVDVRRIASVTPSGNNLVVNTDFVPLNEVITDGTVAWDHGISFNASTVKSIEVPGVGKVYPKTGTPVKFSFDIGKYHYDITVTLDDTIATADFVITKKINAVTSVKLEVTGEVDRFRSADNIVFSGGQTQSLDNALNGMNGDLTLSLVAAGSGTDAVNLTLPATIMTVPFEVGFIPILMTIKIQFVINASVPIDGSCMVKTEFKYNSNLGFSYDGSTVSAGGNLGGITFGAQTNQTGASSAISANFGMGFPRVELDILGNTFVPWAQTAFLVGGTYTVFPACQTADAEFLGAGGYDLSIFGHKLLTGTHTFFDQHQNLLSSGQCSKDSVPMNTLDTEGALLNLPPRK